MVSSGIGASTNVTQIKPVEAGMRGNNSKNASVGFGEFMAQSMSANVDVEKELSSAISSDNKSEISSTATDAAEKIPEKKPVNEANKSVVKEKLAKDDTAAKVDDEIRTEIKEKFGVTDEDIDNALEALGYTMADLLDKGNLMDFIVALTGLESSVDMLVMGDMSAKVDELFGFITDTFEQLAKEFDMPVEEIAKLFDEAVKASDAEVSQQVVEAEVEIESSDNTVAKDITVKNEDVSMQTVSDSVDGDNMPEVKVVEFKSDNDGKQQLGAGADSMQQNIMNNLAEAVTEAFDANGFGQQVDAVSLIEQIVENAKLALTKEVTSMEMMLNPESLGKINLNISVREGVVTATIVAQNETVREAIESQIVMLKENLNNQGLKVEAVEVTVESHAFEANANQGDNNAFSSQQEEAKKNATRPLRTDSLEELLMEDLTEEEQLVLEMMVENGNQINFKA